MTRINCHVSVKKLADEHLLAEHREIKRVCNRFAQRKAKGIENDVPEKFTLGKGHELFFSNKAWYTYSRYTELYKECISRGFNVQDYSDNWKVYGNSKWLDYTQCQSDDQQIIDRIIDNVNNGKKEYYHYYGEVLSKEDYIKQLNS